MDPQEPEIAVINYGMGNLRSVTKALEAVGARIRLVERPGEVEGVGGIVLPGVGAIGDCVEALNRSGLGDTIREWIGADQPFLGVCLGLQALFDSSEEGNVRGLGIFPGQVIRFRNGDLKVPHMGWNDVAFRPAAFPLTGGSSDGNGQFYFVHSYHVRPDDPDLIAGETDYGERFTSMIARGRCFATQFHPEKSQQAGLALYRGFVEMVKDHKLN